MHRTLANIITIGDEILIGQIVDSNSAWLAESLNDIGVEVERIVSIADKREAILEAVSEANQRADLIIITGGLGPTKDDITKHTLCEYFETELKRNAKVEANVREMFKRFNRPILESNLAQADLPEKAEVLWNELGTAPGMLFRKESRIFVSMPGVPYEMKNIYKQSLEPIIINELNTQAIVHRTLMTAGIGESFIAERIQSFESALPKHIKLAYLPRPGRVRLRLSARGSDKLSLQKDLELEIKKLIPLLGANFFGFDEISLTEALGHKLKEKGMLVAAAESCTGGRIGNLFTGIPGSSAYFYGSIVAYSNDLKRAALNVSDDTIKQFGAVSEETLKEMLYGLQKLTGADYCVATTGIAGPDGGTDVKPVGTIWIGVLGPNGMKTKLLNLGKLREVNIERASIAAIFLVWKALSSLQPA